jgi:hypothetical protein
VDKQGVLRDCAFGSAPDLEARVLELLREYPNEYTACQWLKMPHFG